MVRLMTFLGKKIRSIMGAEAGASIRGGAGAVSRGLSRIIASFNFRLKSRME